MSPAVLRYLNLKSSLPVHILGLQLESHTNCKHRTGEVQARTVGKCLQACVIAGLHPNIGIRTPNPSYWQHQERELCSSTMLCKPAGQRQLSK